MEVLIIILAFLTMPLIVYQSIIISNQNKAIENYKHMLEHRDRVINTYLRELNERE